MSDKTGGAAFPSDKVSCVSCPDCGKRYLSVPQQGMTLRDWFAGQALVGWLSDPNNTHDADTISRCCYEYADAMLAERERR